MSRLLASTACDAVVAARPRHDRLLQPTMDLGAAERAAAQLLHALGIDTSTESLRDTPARMVRAYPELFTPPAFDLTTFPNEEGYDELVLVRSIPMRSVCEHHLLPFAGVAHVGYLLGTLRDDSRSRHEFFALTGHRG